MTRTNIDIDDALLDLVMRRYGIHTKTEAVDVALRRLAGEPLTTDEALSLRGAKLIEAVPADTVP
jgi:Arc/MetJ family transcription regulator